MKFLFRWTINILVFGGLLLLGLSACGPSADRGSKGVVINSGAQVKAGGFKRLARIKDAKKQEVIRYFADIKEKIKKVGQDKDLRQIFLQSKQRKKNYDPRRFDEKYVVDYSEFYDVLLVDQTGFVFNSIRQESDFQQNIFSDNLFLEEGNTLSRSEITFVDYENYEPSSESAAFLLSR